MCARKENAVEIHYADKAYRKRALWMFIGVFVLCGVLLWQLHTWLDHLAVQLGNSDPATVRSWIRMLFTGLGFTLAVPAIGLGMTLRQLGQTSRLQGRFPPVEWKTLRDVRVLRNVDALLWSRRIETAATAVLAFAGLLIGWSLWSWWHFG
jgi:hypothetical protein